jgi:hypothetical protein
VNAVEDAARRLIQRRSDLFEGGPWLAESPPNFSVLPICIGCGAQAAGSSIGVIFMHVSDCPAFDLAVALSEEEA